MGYQRRGGSGRGYGGGRGIKRREKAKEKRKAEKLPSDVQYAPEQDNVLTLVDVVDRTLKRLQNLGNQVFALSPFSEYFGRWQTDMRVVLSEFESSPMVNVDDQFLKERSEIFSNIELELEKRRSEEALFNEPIKSLSANRTLLEKIEGECTSKTRDVARKREVEVKRLSSNVEGLREELDRVARMKTGIFRGLSKKAKAKKETEVTQRLSLAQEELASAEQNFAADQERLRHEYEKRKQPVIEQIGAMEKEVEKQDVDGSLETRKAACEALINAVNALVKRKANQTV